MASTTITGTEVEWDFENERANLLKRAEEKPTLQLFNGDEEKTIEEWKKRYPGLALFIEVTKEDSSKVYSGRLVATAESSVEFLDLDKTYQQSGVVSLTTYGNPLDPRPIPLPPIFWLGTELE